MTADATSQILAATYQDLAVPTNPPTAPGGVIAIGMGGGLALNARGQSLIDAVYESLGYTSGVSGSWVPRSIR
jgi:hypothetical protein